ncbi:hypothetical protein IPA_02965 [Ignicoccus pacificus DSM 13166]|uniref:Pyrroline-5-carboxylate reductase n=1 Tax=Ignicoccus pacificus DSM 13166 TaxID=940294 RepID=A0A977KCB7_9CREN|nr:hypothetical protein IPA_02965 [Ignicoccus pacificus DSM 13166]
MSSLKVCLIGYGRLGSAIGRGLKGRAQVKVSTLPPTDQWAREDGYEVVPIEDCASFGDLIIVAVEPSAMDVVLSKIKGVEKPVVSTAALYPLKKIKEYVKCAYRIMPSVTVEVRRSPIMVAERGGCADDKVEELLKILGKPIWSSEAVLDAALPVVGSGPAVHALYYLSLVEAMVYAGVPREIAEEAAKESIIGTLEMLNKQDPLSLRARVETPGGITVTITTELESAGVFGKVSEVLGRKGRELKARR